ncbi:hypothetical protein [Arsenophonus nasoniae]|uniref:hypothetical protein n=1 Tax=Arsenophonus nasoniae TaxID=638 RepID=UPI00387A6134
MQGLLFHLFFVTLCAVFSFVVTGSLWLTLLLFVIFGVIPAFLLNEYRLFEMSGGFVLTMSALALLFGYLGS